MAPNYLYRYVEQSILHVQRATRKFFSHEQEHVAISGDASIFDHIYEARTWDNVDDLLRFADWGGERAGDRISPHNSVASAAPNAVAPASAAAPPPVDNGSLTLTAAVAASGNQRIDGLLSGRRWTGGSISYSDPNAAADYPLGYAIDQNFNGASAQNEGLSQLTNAQRVAAHFALDQTIFTQPAGAAGFSVEAFTNLGVAYAGSGSGAGTIRLANSSDPFTAYAFYPDDSIYGGDSWFGPISGANPIAGNYHWHTFLHEIGHALGLKHGQEAGGVAGALPADVDSLEYSVMTYRTFIGDDASGWNYEAWSAPQTFMMLDIAALQHMYGADYTSNNGNTAYTWNPLSGESYINGVLAIDPGANRIFETIWDGGGIDTYDASNYTTNANIDLRPGEDSTVSTAQLAYLGGGPNGGFARGNVFNALLYNGNTASLIENANGGSANDIIRGNQANNALNGNGGADQLFGEAGNDTLNGGAGADAMDGGFGNDVYVVDNAADVSTEAAGAGTDTVQSSITRTLAVNLENLTLTGTAAINGTGNTVNNVVTGNTGSNTLFGLAGNDTLNGNAGNDTLDGGVGADTLTGALGLDRFDFNFINDSLPGTLRDRISDFAGGGSAAGDVIDLSGIDADGAGGLANGAFNWIGSAAFVAGASTGDLRYASGLLQGSTDADSAAEFEIQLTNLASLFVGGPGSDVIL